jgi:glyoxalase family protein
MHEHDTPQGIHHITAVAGDPARNLTFYRDVLGLRLVKKTVNFDDPSTYHFYFGDELGSPGTILTFFPWPGARPGRLGAGLVETVAFAIPPGTLEFWRKRLAQAGSAVSEGAPVFGAASVRFADPDGLLLELVESEAAVNTRPWAAAGIPAAYAIRSFFGAAERVREAGPTDRFLRERLGFTFVGEDAGRRRYRAGSTGVGVFDLIPDPSGPLAQGGRGTVHHIAWMTADADANNRWRERLAAAGAHVSPLMDRNYFRSIYFREPGGVLFEFATNGPGFAIDEPAASLGTTLKLPAQYEEHRARIEAALPVLP